MLTSKKLPKAPLLTIYEYFIRPYRDCKENLYDQMLNNVFIRDSNQFNVM